MPFHPFREMPEFVPRYQVAKRLGKHPKTVADNEAKWGLAPVRINGQVSYEAKKVDALAEAWRAKAATEAANRATVIPHGWRLLIQNARGPFIGEFMPEAAALGRYLREIESEDKDVTIYTIRQRRCIVSYARLDEAFRVAQAEGLNIISNGRGIVAVKEN